MSPMANREVFALDPTLKDIPNLGVAKVKNPEDAGDWETLEWELRSFVCEGEYERGLERVFSQYLSHLGQAEQPGVWVSGFFGSGKSHLMRVLEYLWRDYDLPSGASARGLATLPDEIETHLAELSTAAKRAGGLWSAAGTLGAGAAGSVRLAFLAVIFDSAGLPQQYAQARLVLWLMNQGIYEQVNDAVTAAGGDLDSELNDLYVSPVLAEALIDAGASFGETPDAVSTALQAQFPMVEDISNEQMLDTFEQVMRLQSRDGKKLPLTLVVLDEMQQYINEDGDKALAVQGIAESCASMFNSQVLVVATGQSALTATPTLSKLIDRFPVSVALSDTDVETVVRQVVLRKKPEAVGAIEDELNKVSGEIDRHLGGTKIEAKAADKADLTRDYPLLPTRRRFWKEALRAMDRTGKAGVLRTQLKIVHEAARSVADEPIGHVIGADFVFRSESASMLQSGVLLREIDELIRGLDDGTPEGALKSRACALVFLISQLPHDGVGDIGVRATPGIIADLLVEDLEVDGAQLRKEVPRVFDELVEQGRVMRLGEELRLQTEEGAEWTAEFNKRRAAIREDAARMSQLRNEHLRAAVDGALAGIKIVQGASKTPRKLDRHWDDVQPVADGAAVPLWFRDEWNVTESAVRETARAAGDESPVVHVLLPKVDADAIRDTLVSYAAALDTVTQRPEPQTDEGRQAKTGMQTRIADGERRLQALFGVVVERARVFQGGGNELDADSLRDGVETAANNALARLFPKFGVGDNAHWDKVISKARDGAPDSLGAVGWVGEVTANPVCKEVLARTSGAGTKGSDLHADLTGSKFKLGWPKDAVDGALLALLAGRFVRAERDGTPIDGPKALPPTQIGKCIFYKEDDPPTPQDRMAVRGLLIAAQVEYTPAQEEASVSGLLQHLAELAGKAGGPAPLPETPDTQRVKALAALAGNQQFREVAAACEPLRQDMEHWALAAQQRPTREAEWAKLERLLRHATNLPEAAVVRTARDAIEADRLLLADPDPVTPLIDQLCSALRATITDEVDQLAAVHASTLSELEASAEWSQISADDQRRILTAAGLAAAVSPVMGTDEELLRALDATPLTAWRERRQALPVKAAEARTAAAQLLEPKAVSVKPTSATIKTEAEVDGYVAELRSQLMRHIDAGETVVI